MLIINSDTKQFDTEEIKRGTLISAKHSSWTEAAAGFVTSASPVEVIVQFPPRVGNVTYHYFIRAVDVAAGVWDIRYTNDMVNIQHYEGGTNDTETID